MSVFAVPSSFLAAMVQVEDIFGSFLSHQFFVILVKNPLLDLENLTFKGAPKLLPL